MKKFILVLYAFAFFCFFSCKKADEKSDQSPQENPAMATSSDTKPQEVVAPVTLDRGQKWIANVETTREIAIMQGQLGEFPSGATVEDYRMLHKKLITGFQSILQKCTMTGEAHTQLHNYLMPLKKMIDTIGTGNLETCNKTFPEMQGYLMKYSHYFF